MVEHMPRSKGGPFHVDEPSDFLGMRQQQAPFFSPFKSKRDFLILFASESAPLGLFPSNKGGHGSVRAGGLWQDGPTPGSGDRCSL